MPFTGSYHLTLPTLAARASAPAPIAIMTIKVSQQRRNQSSVFMRIDHSRWLRRDAAARFVAHSLGLSVPGHQYKTRNRALVR
jgi:hypothetical protein